MSHLASNSPLNSGSDDRASLLEAYDAQLRGEAEAQGALSWDCDGPIYRSLFERSGFVSYESLAGADDIDNLIGRTIAYYRGLPQVEEFEWKTRGHDQPVDLDLRLRRAGFVPDELETVMVGEASRLAVTIELPSEVVIRRVDQLPERAAVISAASRMQRAVFEDGPSAEKVLSRLDRSEGNEQFWVAEASGQVVGAGRLARVPGTEFAGLWGGATDPEWRGKGIYRALTAARAREAVAQGVRYLHSDCTAMSRPLALRPLAGRPTTVISRARIEES